MLPDRAARGSLTALLLGPVPAVLQQPPLPSLRGHVSDRTGRHVVPT